jgi:uncharacterized protein YegP (UPF0339 family)
MRFEYYKSTANGLLAVANGNRGGWRWRLIGDNGEPLASGENYVRKEDCLHVIRLIMTTNQFTPVVETDS